MADLQNFEVEAGDSKDVTIDIAPDEGETLADCQITFKAYVQEHGNPVDGEAAVITKRNTEAGGSDDEIEIDDEDDKILTVHLVAADTLELLRNYYFEVTIIDEDGNRSTVTKGIMTVTSTENRPT